MGATTRQISLTQLVYAITDLTLREKIPVSVGTLRF